MEDAGRGWRRVVASPRPQHIVEIETIRTLVDAGQVVVAAGGGGIPVMETEGNHLKGVPAVIDKDFCSARLAESVDADCLIILTAVEKVAINFGKPNQEWLDELTPERARQLISEGHFAPGSMLPTVQAALQFAESKPEPLRADHSAGKGQGRHRRKDRHHHSLTSLHLLIPSFLPPAGFLPPRAARVFERDVGKNRRPKGRRFLLPLFFQESGKEHLIQVGPFPKRRVPERTKGPPRGAALLCGRICGLE